MSAARLDAYYVTSPERRAKARERMRRLAAERIAQGLTAGGEARKDRPGPLPQQVICSQTRRETLEAVLWLATTSRQPAELMELHAIAAGLPLAWWKRRESHSIEAILTALKVVSRCHGPAS